MSAYCMGIFFFAHVKLVRAQCMICEPELSIGPIVFATADLNQYMCKY